MRDNFMYDTCLEDYVLQELNTIFEFSIAIGNLPAIFNRGIPEMDFDNLWGIEPDLRVTSINLTRILT